MCVCVLLCVEGMLQKAVTVICQCGSAWCFHCSEELHWPASCLQAKNYRLLVEREGWSLKIELYLWIESLHHLKPGPALPYVALSWWWSVSSCGTRQHLWSAETSTLLVSYQRCLTLGDRSFPVAAAPAWNALPQHVLNASSLSIFRRELKTILFRSSFPDVIRQCTVLYLRARRSVLICHHVLAATNWFCWHCTVVLQQQCDNAT